LPKPLLEVGGRPVLAHLLDVFAAQGFTDFVLAAGYKADRIRAFAATLPRRWSVDVVDTGLDTGTGGRVLACRDGLGPRFVLTYADGLADIDVDALVRFHESSGRAATITTVPLPSPYGTVETNGNNEVTAFWEKPRLADHPINAGFFVFEERAFAHWAGDDLERDVLPALARAGELVAYRHRGFWKSLDTSKDAQDLSALCAAGTPPWLTRSASAVS
jgi:glucose-1-phosphate cytidylyltransferase